MHLLHSYGYGREHIVPQYGSLICGQDIHVHVCKNKSEEILVRRLFRICH
jgi:hypothetical protein